MPINNLNCAFMLIYSLNCEFGSITVINCNCELVFIHSSSCKLMPIHFCIFAYKYLRHFQTGVGPSINPPCGTSQLTAQLSGANTPTSQTTTQQGLMMSQTNTMAMGGGQITQNVVTSTGQSGPGLGGVLGQAVNAGGMPPRVRMPVRDLISILSFFLQYRMF